MYIILYNLNKKLSLSIFISKAEKRSKNLIQTLIIGIEIEHNHVNTLISYNEQIQIFMEKSTSNDKF